MRRCPVCEKELIQGLVCDDCGFDASCDYEGRRTLCSVLPRGVEPVSVRAARRRRQQQTAAGTQGALTCPRCGGPHFSFLVGEQMLVCADCGTKVSAAGQNSNAWAPPPPPPPPAGYGCPCCGGSGISACFTEVAGAEGAYRYYAAGEPCRFCGGRGSVSQPVYLDYENKLAKADYLKPISQNNSCQFCHGSGMVVSGKNSQLTDLTVGPGIRMQTCPVCNRKEVRLGIPKMRRRGIAKCLWLIPSTGWLFAAHCFYAKQNRRGILEVIAFWSGAALLALDIPVILLWLVMWVQDIFRFRKMPKYFAVD